MGSHESKARQTNSNKSTPAVQSRKRKHSPVASRPTRKTTIRGIPEPNTDLYGPQADLHRHVNCEKHPGHNDFIPVRQFKKHHLPVQYRHKLTMDFIKAVCEQTVHLQVRTISKDRPKYYPESTIDYPYHIPGGGIRVRSGSGRVWGLFKCGAVGEEHCEDNCNCDECETSGNPKKTWWTLSVCTAAHVLCDTAEVKDASVTLFYDDRGCDTFVTKGHKVTWADFKGDTCEFEILIHDEIVAERLKTATKNVRKLGQEFGIYFGPFLFSVSHPHGCSKQITLGKLVAPVHHNMCKTRIRHDASTCPGCSGGPVVAIGVVEQNRWYICPHSEAMPDGSNRSGYSGAWLVVKFVDQVMKRIGFT